MADGNTLPRGVHEPDPDEIPIGWRAVQLREIASVTGGGRLGLTKVEHYRPSGYPAYSAAGQDGYVHRWEFDRNAVVVPSIGSIGRSYRAEGKWATLANTQVIFPNEQLLSHRFLHWRTDNTNYFPVSGTAQPFIKPGDFPKCWMSLPPLAEQTCIARVLDSIDAAIHRTEAIIAKLKQVKQGLLHDLLTRGIDAKGELRPPQSQAPHLYKPSPLGWIPKEWSTTRIADIGEIVTGSTPPSHDTFAWGNFMPFITPADVLDDRPICNAERSVSSRGARYVRRLPPGTTIVVCIGSTVGKVGVTEVDACSNQQINAVIPSTAVLAGYLHVAIEMHIGQLRGMAGLQAVPIVNKSSFGEMLVPLAPMHEQLSIAQELASTSLRISTEEEVRAKRSEQKSGLMDDLLTGRVRVTPLLEATAAP